MTFRRLEAHCRFPAPRRIGVEAPRRIARSNLPAELRAQLLQERRQADVAAKAFVRACEDGDRVALYHAAVLLDESVDAWRLAMVKIARLPRVSPEVQDALVGVWVERKMLPLVVGNRPVVAAALRVLLPAGYSGPPLMLYRGTIANERRRRLYGF